MQQNLIQQNLKNTIFKYCNLNNELYEENELCEYLEFLRSYMNIRELKSILHHELVIEKEILLFMDDKVPIYKPSFKFSSWNEIRENIEKRNDINGKEAFFDIRRQIEKINSALDNQDIKNVNNPSNTINISGNINNLSFSISEDISWKGNNLNINESNNNSPKIIMPNTESNSNSNNSKDEITIGSNNNIINKNEINSSSSNLSLNNKAYNISNISENNDNQSKNGKNNNNPNKSENNRNQKSKKRRKVNNNSDVVIENNDNQKSKNEKTEYLNCLDISTKLKQNDFFKDIEVIKFDHYMVDSDIAGTLFEADVTNFIYDLLNILCNGKLTFFRNKEYYNNNKKEYEFDFQIKNLNIKHFLYLVYFLYPNISTLETLHFDIKNIFNNLDDAIDKIDKLKIEEIKEYEYVDIIGEVTIDYLNQKIRKNEQIGKFGNLIEQLDNNEPLNKKFNFNAKNKKIVLIFTDGKYDKFYYNFKINREDSEIFKNSKNYNFLYIYIRNKFDNIKLYEEKFKYKYIELLENKVKNNNDKDLKIFKNFHFSDIYNNFYKKVAISQKLDSIRDVLHKIKRHYINKLPKLFFNYLKKKITKEDINSIFEPILNLRVSPEQIKDMNNKYENEKKAFRPYISVFEFGMSEKKLYAKRFKNNKFIVINHEALTYKLEEKNYENEINKYINKFINPNSRNKTIPKIIIIDTKNDKTWVNFLFFSLIKIKKDELKRIHLLCPKKFEYIKILFDDYAINTSYYNDNNENNDLNQKLESIVDSCQKGQFIYWKIINQINFIDKQLTDIIVNDNFISTNQYIDDLIMKIIQEISLYYTNGFSNKLFDENKLKQNIINNNKYCQTFIETIISDISENLTKKIKKIKNDNNNEFRLDSVIINCFSEKFKNYKIALGDVYYKYMYKVYSGLIKLKIQNNILKDYLIEF